MSENEEDSIEEIKRKIVIERLRRAPPNLKISFGMPDGKFLNREELIKQVEKDTEIGRRIIKINLEYLKAFKKQIITEG